jgi:phosphoribosylamine--glycine ligase
VEWGNGWVIKADGLALGKGVVVCQRREEALSAVKDFFGGAFGEAGKCVVVEERLLGREVSAFSLCDGKQGVFLGFACDYKRIFDGDQGPNTGGMGAFSPADWLPAGMKEKIQDQVVRPLLAELAQRGSPFKGTLFTGLMVKGEDFRVLEFNARFGDPETQALLPLLDEDLLPWLEAAEAGGLAELPAAGPRLKPEHAVHVVMASHGYPASARKGDAIEFPAELVKPSLERKLFFAGVSGEGAKLATAGGRVLGLTALSSSREEARASAYRLLEDVKFSGSQRRNDVGC